MTRKNKRPTLFATAKRIETFFEKNACDLESKAAKELHAMYVRFMAESNHGRGRRYPTKADIVRIDTLINLL